MTSPGCKAILAAWLLLMMLALGQLGFRASISSDMGAFMPASGDSVHALLMDELQRGPGSRLILVAMEGGSPEELAAVSRDLGLRLRGTDTIAQVFNGPTPMNEHTRDLLFRYRYLLNSQVGESSFTVAILTRALEQRLAEMASSLSVLQKSTLRSDPTAAFTSLLESWRASAVTMVLHQGIWLSAERDAAYLLLRTTARGTELDAQERVLTTLRATFDEIRGGRSLQLIISGAPVIAVATRDRIRLETFRLCVAATLFMVVFLLLVYRQLRLVLLALLPLLSAVLAAAAVVSAVYGLLHGITVAFGVTLLGVAVDYPVHLFSHRRPGERATACMGRIWATLRLGMLTTVLAFLAMTLTPIAGLSQMGLFAAVGLLVAAGVTRYVLPVFIGAQTAQIPTLAWVPRGLAGVPARSLLWISVGVGALAFGVVLTVPQPWSGELTDLSPVPAALTEQDRELRTRMGAPDSRYLILIQAQSADEVLTRQADLLPVLREAVEEQEIGSFQMASLYLPNLATQRRRQQTLPDEASLRRGLAAASAELPFKPRVFEPFVNDVVISGALPLLAWETFRNAGLQLPLDELLHSTVEGWLGLVRLQGVEQPHAFSLRFRGWHAERVRFVDLKRETGALVDGFRVEVLARTSWALLVALVVLTVFLRDPRRLLRVVGPVLVAVAVAAAVALVSGVRLNLFHVVSLLLVAGISLDYGLFFTRPGVGREEFLATLHGLLVCVISTSTVFALLISSSIPVLHAIGVVVSTGVIAGFLCTWCVSPRPVVRQHPADPPDPR